MTYIPAILCFSFWAAGLAVGYRASRPRRAFAEASIRYLRDRNTELACENVRLKTRLECLDTLPDTPVSEVYIPSCEPSEAITLPKIPSWPPPRGPR